MGTLGKIFMLEVGAIGAGVFLFVRALMPLVSAHRTGAIRSQNHKAELIRRDVDPLRYASLLERRKRALIPPLLMLVGGALVIVFFAWLLRPD